MIRWLFILCFFPISDHSAPDLQTDLWTDLWTDGRTDTTSHRDATAHLKSIYYCSSALQRDVHDTMRCVILPAMQGGCFRSSPRVNHLFEWPYVMYLNESCRTYHQAQKMKHSCSSSASKSFTEYS